MCSATAPPQLPPGVPAFCRRAWEPVFAKVKRAIVFLDSPCAENLHWACGGINGLLQAGAHNVKEFSSFESGQAEQPKAVFVVGTVLKGRTVDVIRDIVSLSNFQYCVVFTGVSHTVHLQAYNTPPGAETESSGPVVFEQFEEKLCQWMGNMNYTAEVHHAALFLAPLLPHLFVMPAFSVLFPLMMEDLARINSARPEKKKISHLSDVDFLSLPSELQLAIRSLVSDLHILLEYLSVREDCFAIGPLSKIIAGDLANYSQAKIRRKNAQNKASVIFVDRTLDLTGAVGHHGDNLAEKILSILPKLPGHTNDVMVNMMALTSLHTNETSCNIIAPGCLAQPREPAAKTLWESLTNVKQKEGLMEVRRHLVEAASRENLPIKMSMGRVTPEQLQSYIQLFKKKFDALENHCGLLQITLAVIQTLKDPQNAKWDNLLAFERLFVQNIGESTLFNALKQLLPIIKPCSNRTADDYTPQELLLLLVYIYSIVGEVKTGKELNEAESQVKEAFVHVICDEPELPPLLQKIIGCESSAKATFQKATAAAVNEIFKSLRDVTRARTHMKQFHSVHIPGNHSQQISGTSVYNFYNLIQHEFSKKAREELSWNNKKEGTDFKPGHCTEIALIPLGRVDGEDLPYVHSCLSYALPRMYILLFKASYKPLMKQVVEEIYNPDRPDPVDIEHMSSGLTDLLKTGFSMFMKVSRPHPSDHPILVIFMVGGVTVAEVRMIKDLVAAHKPGVEVIVLSTTLLTPHSILERLFATDRLKPDIGI